MKWAVGIAFALVAFGFYAVYKKLDANARSGGTSNRGAVSVASNKPSQLYLLGNDLHSLHSLELNTAVSLSTGLGTKKAF